MAFCPVILAASIPIYLALFELRGDKEKDKGKEEEEGAVELDADLEQGDSEEATLNANNAVQSTASVKEVDEGNKKTTTTKKKEKKKIAFINNIKIFLTATVRYRKKE